ncbi:MAG: hypothetical protein KGL39_31120 [Patescibacteria group bacterium]|nr:hypothetical protein [Patescibacteria group bacterium]
MSSDYFVDVSHKGRLKELARDFRDGRLPEQEGSGPKTRWCPQCRTDLGRPRKYADGVPIYGRNNVCGLCEGRAMVPTAVHQKWVLEQMELKEQQKRRR